MSNISNNQTPRPEIFDRRHASILHKWWFDIDKISFIIMLGIIIFGLAMTASSSPAIAKRIEVDKFFFLKKQALFAMIAIALLITISFLDQKRIKILSLLGIICVIACLFLVLSIGTGIKGSKRWISLFGFTLQPSEFAKTFFIIFNAYILQKFYDREWFVKYGVSAISLFIITSLIILQPDLGMTLSLTILWAVQLFVYGIPLAFVSVIVFIAIIGGIAAYITLPHVEDRINKFLDADSKNYQVERSLDAFVNGSYFGTGPGNGVVKKFIPDAHTDFVFAVIGEEYGILGCLLVLVLFAYLITRIIRHVLDEENLFSYLTLCGLMIEFTMQTIINICVSLKLLPTKGMTLPFISYGGSSMLSMSICFGLILALTKKKYQKSSLDSGLLL